MTRSIKVQWACSHYVYGRDDGVRLRIEVVCANEVSTKIFAYRMLPDGPSNEDLGHFSHICSPVDLEEYPQDEPTLGQSPEWFRLNYVDVLVRSVTEAEDALEIALEHIRRLVSTLNTMDTLMTTGTEVVGTDCESSASSEDSSSSSASSESSESIRATSLTATGTNDIFTGAGTEWTRTGDGAGSPIGGDDSEAANYSAVTLQQGEISQMLLVQGFDFSALPDDAVITGISACVYIRDATEGDVPSSSSSASSVSMFPDCPQLNMLTLQHPVYGLGTNHGDFSCVEGPFWGSRCAGSDSDLWGFSEISAEDLKRGSFSVGLVVSNIDGSESHIVEVDGASLVVYYTETV